MSAADEGFTNQRRTEPVPPTPPHGAADAGRTESALEPADAGTTGAGGPGPRQSTDGETSGIRQSAASAPLVGAPPEEMAPYPDLDARTTHGAHQAGQPAAQTEGAAHRAPGSLGETPEPIETDDSAGAHGMRDSLVSSGAENPGDPRSSPAPSYLAAQGTSEESKPVDGVRIAAVAQPGKPDGEVDTRIVRPS